MPLQRRIYESSPLAMFLENSRNLASLCLRRSDITTANIAHVVRLCPNLVNLDVSTCDRLTDEVIEILGNCHKLEILNISECPWIFGCCIGEGFNAEQRKEFQLSNLLLYLCQSISNDSIHNFMLSWPNLKNVSLWGCPQIRLENSEVFYSGVEFH